MLYAILRHGYFNSRNSRCSSQDSIEFPVSHVWRIKSWWKTQNKWISQVFCRWQDLNPPHYFKFWLLLRHLCFWWWQTRFLTVSLNLDNGARPTLSTKTLFPETAHFCCTNVKISKQQEHTYKEDKVFQFYWAIVLLSFVYAFDSRYSDIICIICLYLVKKKGDCIGDKEAEWHKDLETLCQQNINSVSFYCFREEKPTAIPGGMSLTVCMTNSVADETEKWICISHRLGKSPVC